MKKIKTIRTVQHPTDHFSECMKIRARVGKATTAESCVCLSALERKAVVKSTGTSRTLQVINACGIVFC